MASSNVVQIGASLGARTEPAVCDEHGPYEQKITSLLGREFRSRCPACTQRADAEETANRKAMETWERQRNLEYRLGRAAIPKRFADKNFDEYVTDHVGKGKALRVCQEFAEGFPKHAEVGRCMLLLGSPGTGKTHLGAAIANAVMKIHGKTAVYRTIGSVFQEIRDSYGDNSCKTEGEILSPLVAADLLVLDEIGVSKEQPSDFELRTIFAIVNGRYEQCRPTVIISNLGVDEVKVALGERSADRLREGGVIVLLFNWQSARGGIGHD
ncbi:ATP-binding protein [Pseudomonas aeruginosa]|nr:ATP-binding protein [Pseudomonas aeruginosa]